jgi:multidrug efflux pump subunit AcrB
MYRYNSYVSLCLLNLQFVRAIMGSMERKPQQQTLSIRVSDALKEFLERSKKVISGARGESVSTSDVAKILLESAKDDRLDVRLETAELGRQPTA